MNSTVYVLEVWSVANNRYVEYGRWTDRERASITFHKPYNRHNTRRLVKVTRTIDLRAKGVPQWHP
jgi:hypothetical protein